MYKNEEDCKKNPETFNSLAEYNDFYRVLTSWPAVEQMLEGRAKRQSAAVDGTAKRQSAAAIRATLFYMFHKYFQCFYVSIRGGKLDLFYLFNEAWRNPLAAKVMLPRKWSNRNPDDVIDLGSVVRLNSAPRDDVYTMDFTYFKLKYVLEVLLQEGGLPDCDFAIAGRDRLNLKKDGTEASEELVGSTSAPLDPRFKFPDYMPIFSFCGNERFADIAWPTPADWMRIFRGYFKNECVNPYLEPVDLPRWDDRRNVAVFRGSYTGMWADERNPRIKISVLNAKWPHLLDAGISGWKGKWRGRKDINEQRIAFLDPKYERYSVPALTHEQQFGYKYVLYIEGNVAAYRGAFLFSWKSVVLWVRPAKYYLWFEHLLRHRDNCVFVRHDLADLREQIEWLQANDAEAQAIALRGYAFYQAHLTRGPILEFMRRSLCAAVKK